MPLRDAGDVRYAGGFYGQTRTGQRLADGVSVSRLVQLLRSVPHGVTELGCHPGYADDVSTMYRAERSMEVRALCSVDAKRVIDEEEILLMSFGDMHA